MLFAFCLNLASILCTGTTRYTVHSCFGCSRPVLATAVKADGLPTVCSGYGCSPASSLIFLTCHSVKSLC